METTAEPQSLDEQASTFLRYRIGLSIQRYWLPVIVSVGFVCNLLSLLVVLQRQNRHISCCLYMAALAVCDNVVLLFGAHYYLTTEFLNTGIQLWACKIEVWLIQTCSLTCTVMVICMTVDRLVVVKFPLKASIWCSTRRAKITVPLVTVLSLIYTVPYVFSARVLGGRYCIATETDNSFAKGYTWLNILLNAVIPFFCLITMNVTILTGIRGHQQEVATFQGQISGRSWKSRSSKQGQLTAMLLLVSFTFILLTLPQYIRYTLFLIIDNQKDADTYATFMLLYHVTNKLFLTNSAVNFFLYCIGGSKFRAVLKRICIRKKKPQKGAESQDSDSNISCFRSKTQATAAVDIELSDTLHI